MAKLIYSAITSLDGYVEDKDGKFDWAAPDDEVHAFVNDLERPIATYLYGRRMYETMVSWETVSTVPEQLASVRDFAQIWQAAEKVVYSRTLQAVSSARTRIERDFSPDAIRQLKSASESDVTIGGAELAGQAIAAGLVDEYHLFLNPGRGGWRQACTARRCAGKPRARERAALQERRRPPSPPHSRLISIARSSLRRCSLVRRAANPSRCWTKDSRSRFASDTFSPTRKGSRMRSRSCRSCSHPSRRDARRDMKAGPAPCQQRQREAVALLLSQRAGQPRSPVLVRSVTPTAQRL